MTRSRASARKAGSDFEHRQAEYWQKTLRQPDIHVGGKQGVKDKGDILGIRLSLTRGNLTVECKNEAPPPKLGTWYKEAAAERLNNKLKMWSHPPEAELVELESPAAVVVHKRHGTTDPGKQWVHTTVEELIAIITGNRDHIND